MPQDCLSSGLACLYLLVYDKLWAVGGGGGGGDHHVQPLLYLQQGECENQ